MNIPIWCDHVQYFVEDVRSSAAELKSGYGFVELLADSADPVSPVPAARTVVLGQGSIIIALTEPIGPGAALDYVIAHGDGLARIGFRCSDVRRLYARAVAHGARAIEPPRRVGDVWTATLGGIGDLAHTLVEQHPAAPTVLLPGIGLLPCRESVSALGLRSIGNFTFGVPPGELAEAAAHYCLAWGFEEIFDDRITDGSRANNSVVIGSPGGGVTFVLAEPSGTEAGTVDHFLEHHGGAGIQHLAFHTDDIVTPLRVPASVPGSYALSVGRTAFGGRVRPAEPVYRRTAEAATRPGA